MTERIANSESELREILDKISCAPSCLDMGWGFEVQPFYGPEGDDELAAGECGWFIRTTFQRPDSYTGEIGTGYGRWWPIVKGTSESGAVKTAWLAYKQIVEHELMEAFMYEGVRLFDPHASVSDLCEINARRRL